METEKLKVWVLKRIDNNENFGVFSTWEKAKEKSILYPDKIRRNMVIVGALLDCITRF